MATECRHIGTRGFLLESLHDDIAYGYCLILLLDEIMKVRSWNTHIDIYELQGINDDG